MRGATATAMVKVKKLADENSLAEPVLGAPLKCECNGDADCTNCNGELIVHQVMHRNPRISGNAMIL